MDRIHHPRWFRAANALIDWSGVARTRLQRAQTDIHGFEEELRRLKVHGERLHVVWSVHPEVGVPLEPFTVWYRPVQVEPERTDVETWPLPGGLLLTWGGREAVALTARVHVQDPSLPVGLYLLREVGEDPLAAVAVDTRGPGVSGEITLNAHAPFATCAVLVNATLVTTSLAWLEDVIADDGSWQPLERVGHPVLTGELGGYRADDQGLVVAPLPGPEAALSRLERGGPPLGWWWTTGGTRLAPRWEEPDHKGLVEEARTRLFPEITTVYEVAEPDQVRQVTRRNLDGAHQGSGPTYSAESSTADVPLLRTLLLTAGTDAFAALTDGFATAYRPDDLEQDRREIELLVTAHYTRLPSGEVDVELAAYLPPARSHSLVPPVAGLLAARAALQTPLVRDAVFAESIELIWAASSSVATATLTGPTACVLSGFAPADTQAADLTPARLLGGSAVRTIATRTPDPADPTAPVDVRPRLVDPDRLLPYEGSVSRGYAVAQANLFGVYSAWQEIGYTGTAPALLGPRIVHVEVAARYVGTTACPATASVEVAVPWRERTPLDVEVLLVPYPMPTGTTPPPAIDPVTPPGGTIVAHLQFAGDEPISATAGVAVVGLDVNGTELTRTPVPDGQVPPAVPVPRPAGTVTQGEDGRRYRLTVPLGTLDFAAYSRWGVRVFARLRAANHAAESAFSPTPAQPATAVVASPVPIVLPPLPLPPDVPLASTPDDRGRAHVTVAWSDPGSAQADRVVVWEISETSARTAWGLDGVARHELPGWRLDALWDAYDALPADRRKSSFRRLQEVSLRTGNPGRVDVELPRGSRDIHLFVVTTATTTGLESPWPDGGGAPHLHLQAALAPVVVRPTLPVVRPGVLPSGSVAITFSAASALPVATFELFASRSAVAALDHRTMGLPYAPVAAAPSASGEVDVVTRAPVYSGSWTGTLPPSWDPWYLRATAVPVALDGPAAMRGGPSEASEAVPITLLPTVPPDLDALVADVSADGASVVVRSATRAPDRAVPAGSHTVSATLDGVSSVAPVALETLVIATSEAPPAGPLPALGRFARASGVTPLRLWFTRADPTAAVIVELRLADPLGRVTTRSLVVPGWVPPVPPPWVRIDDVFSIVGRMSVATIATSLPPDSQGVLRLTVTRRVGVLRPVRTTTTYVIADVPFARRPPVSAVASKTARGDGGTDLTIRLGAAPTTLGVEVTAPDGASARDSWPRR